jgi:thiol-disulfide isomerase/thioredoxin
MWMRILATMLAVTVSLGGCMTDPELVKRIDGLEATVKELQARPAGPAGAADPKKEAAAQKMAEEIQKAIADMDVTTAKAKAAEFNKNFSGTKAARYLKRVLSELDVVGREAGNMDVTSWFQGTAAMNDGTATMLVFWEEWCPHCKREVPKIEATHNKYKAQGLNVVGLTKVTRSSTDEKVASFISEESVSYPMAKEDGDNLSKRFGVRGVPAAAIVKGGKVVWRGHPARIDDKMIEKVLAQ